MPRSMCECGECRRCRRRKIKQAWRARNGGARDRAYLRSAKGKAAVRRYRRTAKGRAALRAYADRNRRKKNARQRVYDALRAGRLTRGPCERKGPGCRGRIQAHHDDYDQPLEVRWACAKHHREIEQEEATR